MVMREYTNGDCYSSLTHSSPESKCVNARMSLLKTVGEQFAALLLKAKKRQRPAHSKTLREGPEVHPNSAKFGVRFRCLITLSAGFFNGTAGSLASSTACNHRPRD
jgi:hypothetical protein